MFIVISFQRQLNDDGSTNAITQEYDLYADIDDEEAGFVALACLC